MRLRSLLAIADQGLVSAANLVVALAFIHFGSKEIYGSYGLLFAGMLLAQSIQGALIVSPMTTVLPGLDAEARAAASRGLVRYQVMISGILALILSLVAWHFRAEFPNDETWLLFPAFGLAVVGVLAREAVRGFEYLSGRVGGAFAGTVLYAGTLTTGVGALALTGQLSLAGVFGLTALAGFMSALPALTSQGLRGGKGAGKLTPNIRAQLWQCARWAFPSVFVSWIAANAYVYPVGALMGAAVVADISAARLFMVPISLISTGWANLFRPRASQYWAQGQVLAIELEARRWRVRLGLVTAAFGAFVLVAFPMVEPLLGAQYAGLSFEVASWAAYFTVLVVRGVGTVTMLASPDGFRPLHAFGWLSIAVTLVLVPAAAWAGSAAAVVWVLVLSESVLLALIWLRGWPRLRERAARPPHSK